MSRQNTREQEALVGNRAGQGLLVWAVVGCWLVLAVLILLVRQFPADYFYHLRLGQLVWEEHRIPTRDIFSYTAAGYPAYPHEWLADVAMYLLNSKSHLLLFVLLKLVAPLMALALVAWQSYKRCGSWVAVTAAGLVALLMLRSHADVRPLTLSWILIALFYWVLMGGEKPSRWLWVLPPLALLWANLHGSAPMGLALFVLALLVAVWRYSQVRHQSEEAAAQYLSGLKQLALAGFATAACLSINPQGPGILLYPLKISGNREAMDFILEWQSPNFHDAASRPLLAGLLLTLVTFAFARKRPQEYLLAPLLLVMVLSSQRHGPLMGLLLAPMWAEGLVAIWDKSSGALGPAQQKRLLTWLMIALLVCGGALAYKLDAWLLETPAKQDALECRELFPVQACDWLAKVKLSGNGFNMYHWGGYIIYRLWPEVRVFVDGRADVFYTTSMKDYIAIHKGACYWQSSLDKWEVDWALLENYHVPVTLMELRPTWRRVYFDGLAVIYVRSGSPADLAASRAGY